MLKQCSGCEFVYLENPVEYPALVEEFAWERTFQAEKQRRKAAEPGVQRLSRMLRRFRKRVLKRNKLKSILRGEAGGGNLLDIGCGRGKNLVWASEKFIPFGIEISRELATRANEVATAAGGFVVHADGLTGLTRFEDGFFSFAVLTAFLEHENQPARVLSGVLRVLRPGGRVVIKAPNYGSVNRRVRGSRWCGFRFPDHVNYFTPETLRRMMERQGFRIRRFSFRDRHPLSDNMWMIAERP